MNNQILAIILVILATFFGTLMGVFLKLAQYDINVFTAGFLRFATGLLIILPYIFYTRFKVYKTNHFKLHLLRSIINLPMMLLGFGALVYISLEQFNAIHFIVPLIVTLLAVIIFKEKIYFIRISALIIGFIGMLIMLRPGIVEMNVGVYMILASCLMWSFIIIISKSLAKDDGPMTILTYQYSFMSIFSFFVVLFYWDTPSKSVLIFIILAAICGTILHIALNYSYKLVDLSVTQPITFFGLIWGSLLGYFVFNDKPDFFTWIGGIIIFSGVLIITYRESYLKKNIAKNSIPIKT
tara:strand:- start:1165 stop:2052 length:888 start_codon:yes stop_codon:yes gene_type:complete